MSATEGERLCALRPPSEAPVEGAGEADATLKAPIVLAAESRVRRDGRVRSVVSAPSTLCTLARDCETVCAHVSTAAYSHLLSLQRDRQKSLAAWHAWHAGRSQATLVCGSNGLAGVSFE